MKAKRIIALLLVTVLSLGVLASCGSDTAADNSGELKKLSISDVYNADVDFYAYMENNKTYTSHTNYTFLSEKSVLDDSDIFVLYENTSVDPIKYTVYNLALEKEVFSIETSKAVDIELDDYYFSVVAVDENGKEKTTVYNNNGETIYTTDGYYDPDSFGGMFLRIGNSVYSTNPDYSLTKICELPTIIDGDIEYMQFIALDDAYLIVDTDEDGDVYSIAYYSKDFKLISAYMPNSYFDDFNCAILANGNALITGIEYLEEDATEFDFYGDGEKVKVSYFIFDYKENSTTEIDLGDYVLMGSWIMNELVYSYISSDVDFYDIFNEDVENIATLYKINNQHIDYSMSYDAVINNDGTIVGYVNSQVPYQYESAQPWGNYYVAYTDFASYILDKDGDVLLEIPSNDIEFTEYGIYDRDADKLYSFNESTKSLDLVKDFSDFYIRVQEDDFMLYSNYNEVSELTDYYFYSKTGGEKKVAVPQGFEIFVNYNAYYEVLSDELFSFTMYSYNEETYEYTYEYHYYNNEGTLLFKSELDYDYYKTFDSFAIIEAYNSETGKYVYKKISVAAPAVTPTA